MSENPTLKTLKAIHDSCFQQYLKTSEQIGGNLYEQSKNVDNIFTITLELVELFSKYKTPVNQMAVKYILDPVMRETAQVTKFEGKASEFIFAITLISKSSQVFEWVRELDTVKFVDKLDKYLVFYREKAQAEMEELGLVHQEWLRAWSETYEEFSIFVCNFFKNGIQWTGTIALPVGHVLGDSHIQHKTQEHHNMLNELKRVTTKVFMKNDKTWHLEGQQHNHNLIINTASKNDSVHIYACEECTIIVENSVEMIQINSCKKLTLLMKTATKLDLLQCTSCNLHCFDLVPKIEMISCEACSLYLSDKSLESVISTSRCIGITVNYPFDDGVYQTFTISDQLFTRLLPNKGIKTTIK